MHAPPTRYPLAAPSAIGLIALAAALAHPPPAAGQGERDPAAGAFGERIEVELIDVEVWVTDRDRRPVRGLTAADFEVRHDGQPVEITHFSEIRSGQAVAATAPAAGEVPSPAAPATAEPAHLIVYFDQTRLEPGGYRSTIEGLRGVLAGGTVPPERVLVLRQDAGLHLEAPFGSSAKEIDAGLDRIAGGAAAGLAVATEVQRAKDELLTAWEQASSLSGTASTGVGAAAGAGAGLGTGGGNTPRAAVGGSPAGGSSIVPSGCDLFEQRAQPILDGWVQTRRARIAATLANLDAAAGFVAALPGVKTFVYVSDGLDVEPGAALASMITDLCPVGGRDHELRALADSLASDFRTLARRFNANRVTIHALQGSGLTAAGSGAAGSRGTAGRAGNRFDSRQRESDRSGLSLLAGETGGRAVFNRNDLRGELEEIGREMANHYSLAYPPPPSTGSRAGRAQGDSAAEREHRIEVTLRDGSLTARHRRGIRAPDRDTWMDDRLAGALHLGITSNPLDVRLGMGDAAAGTSTVRLYAMVPVDRLVFVPAEGGEIARLQVRGNVQSSGRRAPAEVEREFRLRKPPGADDQRVTLPIELELGPGLHVVALGLRDANSGEASFVTTSFEIGR